MKKEMNEVVRLTRKGRLGEAMALIRRKLGLEQGAPSSNSARVVELTQIEAKPENTTEPPAAGPSTAGETETENKAPGEQGAPGGGVWPPGFNLNGIPSPLKGGPAMPGSKSGMPMPPANFKMPGPLLRQIPAEAVAPAVGRWIEGGYTGANGGRAYKLYIPSGYHGQPLPLVVMLHGCTQSPNDFAAGTRMNFLAEEAGFLVVYPEQAAVDNSSKCWNWFQPAHQQRDQGEPSFIAGITRQVMAEYHLAPGRVYVAGLSAGGAMAAILAAAYSELYAAVGVHSGLAPGVAHDLSSGLQAMQQGGSRTGFTAAGRGIPLILFQGDQDSTVHPRNAEELLRQWASAPEPQSETARQGQVAGGRAYTCEVYRDPNGRVIVERWTVHGAGHAWAGGSHHGSFTDPVGPDASRELVRFFLEQQGS